MKKKQYSYFKWYTKKTMYDHLIFLWKNPRFHPPKKRKTYFFFQKKNVSPEKNVFL